MKICDLLVFLPMKYNVKIIRLMLDGKCIYMCYRWSELISQAKFLESKVKQFNFDDDLKEMVLIF